MSLVLNYVCYLEFFGISNGCISNTNIFEKWFSFVSIIFFLHLQLPLVDLAYIHIDQCNSVQEVWDDKGIKTDIVSIWNDDFVSFKVSLLDPMFVSISFFNMCAFQISHKGPNLFIKCCICRCRIIISICFLILLPAVHIFGR